MHILITFLLHLLSQAAVVSSNPRTREGGLVPALPRATLPRQQAFFYPPTMPQNVIKLFLFWIRKL